MRVRSCLALLAFTLSTGCAGFVAIHESPPEPAPVRRHPSGSVHPAHLGIPPGHLPPPGECRVWFPGRPPGHQPPPSGCDQAAREAPPGAWVIHRPQRERLRVAVYDESRPRVIIALRCYDAFSGEFLYEEEDD